MWDHLHEQLVFRHSVLDDHTLENLWIDSFNQVVLKFSFRKILTVQKDEVDGIDHVLVCEEVDLAEALSRLYLGTEVPAGLAEKSLGSGVN